MAFEAVYPVAQSATYVKETSIAGTGFEGYKATNPALSKIGSTLSLNWQSLFPNVTDQKINIQLSASTVAKRLYIENGHFGGLLVSRGINNFTVYGTNSSTAFANTTYSDTTDLTLLGTFQADAHVATDTEDPQYFDLSSNTTSYLYYVFRFADNHGDVEYILLRHIEIQKEVVLLNYDSTGGALAGGEASIFTSYSSNMLGGAIAGGGAGIVQIVPLSLKGSIGFSGELNANQWLNTLSGSIGFNGIINTYQEGLLFISSSIGFNGSIDIDQPRALSLLGGIGLGGTLNISQDEILSIKGSIGFDGELNIDTQNLLVLVGEIGFSSFININPDIANSYSLSLHNSTRWV